MNTQTIQHLTEVANALADAARPVALQYFRKAGQGLENKDADGFDPVTLADRGIERVMREFLDEHRPDDAILGEEFGAKSGTSGLTWVLDPIDGTRGFISGTPTWGVLIAVGPDSGPIVGIVDQPFTGERFLGTPGGGVWIRGDAQVELGVRACADVANAVLFTTFPEIGSVDDRRAFGRVAERAQLVRYGMDCYAYALLAAGQVDLVIEAGLNAYDIQGPMAVVEAAGGIVTTWDGGPAQNGGRIIAAGDARVHEQALNLLSG